MTNRQQLAEVILGLIHDALAEKGLDRPDLDVHSPIDSSLGLNSLDWAVIVVRLEDMMGVDPFRKGISRAMRTVDDLIDVYWHELGLAG